jgi:hypothetical protein
MRDLVDDDRVVAAIGRTVHTRRRHGLVDVAEARMRVLAVAAVLLCVGHRRAEAR